MDNEKSGEGDTAMDALHSDSGLAARQNSPDLSLDAQCPESPEDMAEEVYLGRAEPEAAILFHVHLETCSYCRQVYEETVQFVDAIRAAAQTFESVPGSKAN